MPSEFATLTTKGQLVIPARLRRKYAMKKGTRVAISEEDGRLILQPITSAFIRGLRGSLGKNSRVLDILYAERRRERKL